MTEEKPEDFNVFQENNKFVLHRINYNIDTKIEISETLPASIFLDTYRKLEENIKKMMDDKEQAEKNIKQLQNRLEIYKKFIVSANVEAKKDERRPKK